MVPRWPAELPQSPLEDGFSDQDDANLIESPTETGPGKTRPQQSHAAVTAPAILNVTKAQKRALRIFHREALAFGSIPFEWPGMDEAIDDGRTHAYRMTQPPKFTPDGDEWRAELQLKAW